MLWSRGYLSPEKRIRYAGVLYGLDPLDMIPPKGGPDGNDQEPHKRDEILNARVQQNALVAGRHSALRRWAEESRGVVLDLKMKRERQDLSGKVFESYLQQLETENTAGALREIRTTLEALSPKQSKDIITSMLADPDQDPGDNVMSHIVAIVQAMPADKMKKIAGEFKTENERVLLHEILADLGNLRDGAEPPAEPSP